MAQGSHHITNYILNNTSSMNLDVAKSKSVSGASSLQHCSELWKYHANCSLGAQTCTFLFKSVERGPSEMYLCASQLYIPFGHFPGQGLEWGGASATVSRLTTCLTKRSSVASKCCTCSCNMNALHKCFEYRSWIHGVLAAYCIFLSVYLKAHGNSCSIQCSTAYIFNHV